MRYKLKTYSIYEFGQRKDSQGNPHQEDSIFPAENALNDNDRLFILCDGMGGHDAGEVASATVCEAMSNYIINDGHDDKGEFTIQDFAAALDAAYNALDTRDSGAEKKMGTTMTFLKLFNEGAFIAHIGDSRVYHIRPGKTGDDTVIMSVTRDHSLINDLIKLGELTPEEARTSRQKNVITRAMQPAMDHRPRADVFITNDIRPGDFFYLCSDGMLEQEEMENGNSLKNIFSEMGGDDLKKVEILRSVTASNRDNHSAFIIHVVDVIDPVASVSSESYSIEPSPLSDSPIEAVHVTSTDNAVTATLAAKTPAAPAPKAPASPGAKAPAPKAPAVPGAKGQPTRQGTPTPAQPAPKKGNSMKGVITLLAIVVIGAGAYFGVKKFLPNKGAETEQTTGDNPGEIVDPTGTGNESGNSNPGYKGNTGNRESRERKNQDNGKPTTYPAVTPAKPEKDNANQAKPETKSEPKSETKSEAKPEPKTEAKPETKPEPKSEPKTEPKPEPKTEPKPEPKPEPKGEPKPEPKGDGEASASIRHTNHSLTNLQYGGDGLS